MKKLIAALLLAPALALAQFSPSTSTLATEATLAAESAKLPASLGAKTGAASLSVVPNSDTAFPVTAASLPLPFTNPLKSTAATLIEAATLTATITGGVYINCQGYIAP